MCLVSNIKNSSSAPNETLSNSTSATIPSSQMAHIPFAVCKRFFFGNKKIPDNKNTKMHFTEFITFDIKTFQIINSGKNSRESRDVMFNFRICMVIVMVIVMVRVSVFLYE